MLADQIVWRDGGIRAGPLSGVRRASAGTRLPNTKRSAPLVGGVHNLDGWGCHPGAVAAIALNLGSICADRAKLHDWDLSLGRSLVLIVRSKECGEAWPQALAFVGRGDRGEHRHFSALDHDRGLWIRPDVREPRRILVVPAEGGSNEVAVSVLQVHERLGTLLVASASRCSQEEDRTIEEAPSEAAATPNDGETVEGSNSPDQPLRWARAARCIDPL